MAGPGWTQARIVEALEARGVRRDRAVQYAEAYLEYQAAAANLAEHGVMVLHPRTQNPIENPYLAIRDRAWGRLTRMLRRVDVGFLW